MIPIEFRVAPASFITSRYFKKAREIRIVIAKSQKFNFFKISLFFLTPCFAMVEKMGIIDPRYFKKVFLTLSR